MGTITSGIGLISGLNTKDIIDQLMAIEEQPKTLLQQRVDKANQQKLAYTDLVARLTTLRMSAQTLKSTTSFQKTSASSSNENVLTVSTGLGAAPGSYQFQVARLVAAQQAISNGFASDQEKVGAGTITIEMGGGEVSSQTPLSQLNGGNGVSRGVFRITDGSGRSGLVNISASTTLDDVVKQINTSLDVSVHAEIQGDHLQITDQSGQTTTNLTISDLGSGHSAADLGIVGSAAGAITGSDINTIGRGTLLSQLNDGRGVRTTSGSADFRITDGNGATYDVAIGGDNTLGAMFDAINTATGGKVTAGVGSDGKSIALTDNTGGGNVAIAALNSSDAVADLGLDGTPAGGTLSGKDVMASIGTVLLSSLRGGSGLDLGTVNITDRGGASTTIDFSSAQTVQDVLDLINNNGVAHLSASLKDSGNGIQITDTSGGNGDLVIADASSTTAAELGIAGTFNAAVANVSGANLQRQWINENTQLSTYNGGKGVTAGKIRVTNSAGMGAEIDLTGSVTLGDVIQKINAATVNGAALGVTASINANGDGLLLTDTAGGGGKLTVAEDGSTTAADLNIKGTATDTTIDGTFEETIALTADDTLASAIDKINAPGFGVSATVINDGSGAGGYRLSLTARNSGRAGRIVIDGGDTSLQTHNLVEGQDAVVFYGGGSNPLLITSSSNQIASIVKGVTFNLQSASNTPVTVNVSASVDNVVTEMNNFVSTFNDMISKINDLTSWDSTTNTAGLLLGDGTVQNIETQVYSMLYATAPGGGQYKTLMDMGLTASGDNGQLQFDEDKFRAAYAADPDAVKTLFTQYNKSAGSSTVDLKGLGAIMEDSINTLIDPVSGIVTLENKNLDDQTTQFQDRMNEMDTLLAAKRSRLESQFANLETVLAGLQSQQKALSSLSVITSSSSSSSSSSTSS